MSRRISDLLQEMHDIFGGEFGDSVDEAWGRSDAPWRMPAHQASRHGLLTKKKGGNVPGGREQQNGMKAKSKKKFGQKMQGVRAELGKSEKADSKKADVSSSASSSGGGSAKGAVSGGKAGGSRSKHYAFKRSANLGTGPKGKHHDETKCWKCGCSGGIYTKGCMCTSTGKGEDCPTAGTKKKIKFHETEHRAYNKIYHAWRASKGGEVTRRLGSTRT